MPLLPPPPRIRSPEVEQIWVVVPHSRPEFLRRAEDNFARQRFPGKRLLIVANGAAASDEHWIAAGCPRASWITSREHVALAKNEALAHIRKQGGGFFTVMDDDDWYGPDYLDELAGYAKSYDAIGKQWHFVSLGEGLPSPRPQLLLCNRRYADRDNQWLTGGTISAWAEEAIDFPVLTEGEDIQWCARMQQRGARVHGTSIYHYLYRRSYAGARHAWKSSRDAFLKAVKPHEPYEFPLTAACEIDLGIVSGERPPTHYRTLGYGDFRKAP